MDAALLLPVTLGIAAVLVGLGLLWARRGRVRSAGVAAGPVSGASSALQGLARARDWVVRDGAVEGKSDGRWVRVAVVPVGLGERQVAGMRVCVGLGGEAAEVLDGWASWPEDHPRHFRGLPPAVAKALGETYEWLLDTSSRVRVSGGELVADHPEPLEDAETIGAIVDGIVEYAGVIDGVCEDGD